LREQRRQPADAEWRMRRVMRMYSSGEGLARIARLVGWSEGRVRKVLRGAGVVVPEGDGGGSGSDGHGGDRRRLLEAGWETKLRGGIVVWHRPDGRGSWYTEDVALEILESMEEEGDDDGSYQ
jgi:hypothetical protein